MTGASARARPSRCATVTRVFRLRPSLAPSFYEHLFASLERTGVRFNPFECRRSFTAVLPSPNRASRTRPHPPPNRRTIWPSCGVGTVAGPAAPRPGPEPGGSGGGAPARRTPGSTRPRGGRARPSPARRSPTRSARSPGVAPAPSAARGRRRRCRRCRPARAPPTSPGREEPRVRGPAEVPRTVAVADDQRARRRAEQARELLHRDLHRPRLVHHDDAPTGASPLSEGAPLRVGDEARRVAHRRADRGGPNPAHRRVVAAPRKKAALVEDQRGERARRRPPAAGLERTAESPQLLGTDRHPRRTRHRQDPRHGQRRAGVAARVAPPHSACRRARVVSSAAKIARTRRWTARNAATHSGRDWRTPVRNVRSAPVSSTAAAKHTASDQAPTSPRRRPPPFSVPSHSSATSKPSRESSALTRASSAHSSARGVTSSSERTR